MACQPHAMDADLDRRMMERAIALAVRSGEEGEYPYGVVICRDGQVVAESINRVAHERDVTRHAEVVAISDAQKKLDTVSLDDCTIYVSAESCAYCCYAIRAISPLRCSMNRPRSRKSCSMITTREASARASRSSGAKRSC